MVSNGNKIELTPLVPTKNKPKMVLPLVTIKKDGSLSGSNLLSIPNDLWLMEGGLLWYGEQLTKSNYKHKHYIKELVEKYASTDLNYQEDDRIFDEPIKPIELIISIFDRVIKRLKKKNQKNN